MLFAKISPLLLFCKLQWISLLGLPQLTPLLLFVLYVQMLVPLINHKSSTLLWLVPLRCPTIISNQFHFFIIKIDSIQYSPQQMLEAFLIHFFFTLLFSNQLLSCPNSFFPNAITLSNPGRHQVLCICAAVLTLNCRIFFPLPLSWAP